MLSFFFFFLNVLQGYFFSISYMRMHDIFDCAQKKNFIKKIKRKRKGKKNQNAFTWLQACFLGNVRDILCNFLDDSHFQTNVIDDVENLFDYYLHITFFVLCTLTSCTHYTQINAKFCTYDCMLTNLVIFDYSWSDVWYIFFGWVDFEEKCFRSF